MKYLKYKDNFYIVECFEPVIYYKFQDLFDFKMDLIWLSREHEVLDIKNGEYIFNDLKDVADSVNIVNLLIYASKEEFDKAFADEKNTKILEKIL